MERIDDFTPAMYYAWLMGQAIGQEEVDALVEMYSEVYHSHTEVPYVNTAVCVDPVTVYPYSDTEVVPF